MSVPVSGPYRPRTMVHPGPVAPVRLEHVSARGQRQWYLRLPTGQTLLSALTAAMAQQGVHAASMALIGGELDTVAYCLPIPDPEGQLIATYGAPLVLRHATLLRGSATLGQGADGLPVVHCHASFADAQGTVRGGHVLTDRTVVGHRPLTVMATALDGIDLRLGFDPETRLHMLRPTETPHD
jgi:predicted DNA-binding protein with PD1-like motif